MDITRDRIFRAKKPANVAGLVNDRHVLHVTATTVQYDGPAVGFGRNYPTVSRAQFEAWAGEDVTGTLPPGEWLDWAARPRAVKQAGKPVRDTTPVSVGAGSSMA